MATPKYQTPATVESTHQMIVAVVILGGVGMLLVILAGQSKTAGNAIAVLLGLLVLEQGITHVNPFVSFLANHPLIPTVATDNSYQGPARNYTPDASQGPAPSTTVPGYGHY